jgi:cbb3-type cytochrome oxidase subunit 1
VGWVALALAGLVYLVLPHCATTGWARVHVWLHNLGLPLMLVSLNLYVAGIDQAEPWLAVGSLLVLLGLAADAVNLFRHGTRR